MLQLDGSSTFGTAQHCLPLPSASMGLKPLNCGSVTNPNEPSFTNPLWTSVDQCGPHPSPTLCSVWTTVDHTSKLFPFSIRRSTLLHCRLFTFHFCTFALPSIQSLLCTAIHCGPACIGTQCIHVLCVLFALDKISLKLAV